MLNIDLCGSASAKLQIPTDDNSQTDAYINDRQIKHYTRIVKAGAYYATWHKESHKHVSIDKWFFYTTKTLH